MKYLVTGYKTDWVEVEAGSEEEAEEIGSALLGGLGTFWDYLEVQETEEEN